MKKNADEAEEKALLEEKERAEQKLKSMESVKDKLEETQNDNLSSSPSYNNLQT